LYAVCQPRNAKNVYCFRLMAGHAARK